MKSIINFIVKNKEKNLRVDTLLANQHNKLTRSRVKTLILENNLKINNLITVDPSRKVKLNDEISFNIVEPKKENLKPFKYNLDIIYEDKDLIVINKSAGISMHPGPGNYDNTIVNALINYSGDNLSNVGNELRPGIVHRIDKDTSGLVVIAKNNFSHEHLSKQFSEHSITRVYYALVWGKIRPQNGKIETLIARSSKNRQMMEVSFKKGKRAVTNYKTLEVYETKKIPTFSLVECKLETGRTHQIRVHLSNMGNNILGDKKYKKKFKKLINIDPSLEKLINELNRQFLHAKSLGFNHPTNNKRLEFSSNLPSDLENILKKLSKIK
jgi:23S rRNA pseudouridine1911/1915/1917 synthase